VGNGDSKDKAKQLQSSHQSSVTGSMFKLLKFKDVISVEGVEAESLQDMALQWHSHWV
jgi:hypothetical protein